MIHQTLDKQHCAVQDRIQPASYTRKHWTDATRAMWLCIWLAQCKLLQSLADPTHITHHITSHPTFLLHSELLGSQSISAKAGRPLLTAPAATHTSTPATRLLAAAATSNQLTRRPALTKASSTAVGMYGMSSSWLRTLFSSAAS